MKVCGGAKFDMGATLPRPPGSRPSSTIGQRPPDPDTLHIVKPYEPGELFAALRRLTQQPDRAGAA